MNDVDLSIINWPGLNWFIHVLANDVGRNEWVKMTPSEQEAYDKEHSYNKGYPYKVITHPIPKGKDIILNDSKQYEIKCNSEELRNWIIQLAQEYTTIEKQRDYFRSEKHYDTWHKVEELRPHSPASSLREEGQLYLVYGSSLPYVSGHPVFGFRKGTQWYITIDGKDIEHPVTHFRPLPPNPVETVPYEEVKEEVNKLRKILGYEEGN